MGKYRVKQDAEAPGKINLEALARLREQSQEFLAQDRQVTITALEAQALRYETALERYRRAFAFSMPISA